MYVQIGGIDQWIQLSENNPEKPTLLFLHGGPGGTSVPLSATWKLWEEHFTVVHWDQRGAGRTYAKNGEAGCGHLSIDRMVQDAMEVVEFLIETLRKAKILLVGHSWGSALGVYMLKRRPERFSAFVGTGQLVNKEENEQINYRRQIGQAQRAENHDAIQALRAIGPPPYPDRSSINVLREWADRLADGDGDPVQAGPPVIAPGFTPGEIRSMRQGAEFSRTELYEEINAIDLPSLGVSFDIPIFFFHGTCDQQTPIELAERYFGSIIAPHKEFVRFEGCHHFVVMNRPELFLRELVARVRPHL